MTTPTARISALKANAIMREEIAKLPAEEAWEGSVDLNVARGYPENLSFQVERPHPTKPTRIASRWYFTDEDGPLTEDKVRQGIADHVVAINNLHDEESRVAHP